MSLENTFQTSQLEESFSVKTSTNFVYYYGRQVKNEGSNYRGLFGRTVR